MRLFEEFLQRKMADFRKLESFRPEASDEAVSHSEIEITIDASEDTKAKEIKPVDKEENKSTSENLVITIDSEISE